MKPSSYDEISLEFNWKRWQPLDQVDPLLLHKKKQSHECTDHCSLLLDSQRNYKVEKCGTKHTEMEIGTT